MDVDVRAPELEYIVTYDAMLKPPVVIAGPFDVGYDGEPVRAKSVTQAWGEAGAAETPGQEPDLRL